MKIARLLCAIWMCTPLALEAGAADGGAPERAAAEGGGPGQSSGQHASPAGRAAARQSTRMGSPSKGPPPNGAVPNNAAAALSPRHGPGPVTAGPFTPERGAGQLSRSNADRLHSLLRTQAHAPGARPGSRPAAQSSRSEGGGSAVARTPDLRSPVRPSMAVSKSAARTALSANPPVAKAVNRGSLVGGPHPAGAGRVGGPAMGRAAFSRTAAANRAALDGAQMRRRF
jgi:hypothetical protein